MAANDVIKYHLKSTRRHAARKQQDAINKMDSAMSAMNEVERAWGRFQPALTEEKNVSCASVVCEIGNLQMRLAEAIALIHEATWAANEAREFQQAVEFDAAKRQQPATTEPPPDGVRK